MGEQPLDFDHGTLSSYTRSNCRCEVCREFWNRYMRWWRADQRGRLHTCPTCSCVMPEKPVAALAEVRATTEAGR